MSQRARPSLEALGAFTSGAWHVHAGDGQWTRYAFDQNAHLHEEGGRPSDSAAGAAGGSCDGGGSAERAPEDGSHAALGLGRLNAVTFRQSVAAAEQQGRDQSHEAAIFGRTPPAASQPRGAGGVGAAAAAGAPHGSRAAALRAPLAAAAAAAAEGGGGRCAGLGPAVGRGAGEEPWRGAVPVDGDGEDGPVVVWEAADKLARIEAEATAARQGAAAGAAQEGPALGWRERAAQLRAQRAKQA